MSTLVNLVISFIMGLLFGHQIEDPKTAHHESDNNSIEIYQKLEKCQQMLDC